VQVNEACGPPQGASDGLHPPAASLLMIGQVFFYGIKNAEQAIRLLPCDN